MTFKITAAIAAASLMFAAAAPAFAADNGTTLAGPAQGSKADGSSSMAHPSAESGASGGAMMQGGGALTGHADSPATGTMSGGSTATGGNVGGPAGRN